MSDDKDKAAEAAKLEADAKAKKADELRGELEKLGVKTYDETAFKELVRERDEVKRKSREREEIDKKAADAKLLDEGKVKELLTQREAELEQSKQEQTRLREKAEMYEAQQKAMRELALGKIVDLKARAIAEKLPDTAAVMEFAELQSQKSVGVDTTKGARSGASGEGDPYKLKPGENQLSYLARLRKEGLIKD